MKLPEQQPKMSWSPLIVAGQFPPPINGFTYITQEMAKVLSMRHQTKIIDILPKVSNNGVSYHFCRLFLTLRGLWTLLRSSFSKNRRFYIACEGGFGIVYTLILCAAARVFGYPIIIHHHSFAYIENSSILMTCLLSILGKHATHIFLCRLMAQRYAERYQLLVKCYVLSNSAFVDVVFSTPRKWQEGQPLVIGLLGNLNDEKGLGVFLDILRGTKAERLNIASVLAGPPVTESDRNKISIAKQELGYRLDYLGPVYDEAKTAFYNSIDVFVFPTRYVNEAQPTVIFEAMAHGVPVLSYDRGCIRGQIGACGAVLAHDGDFVPFAIDWLKTLIISPEILEKLKLDAKAAFLKDRDQAKQSAEMLFELDPIIIQPSLNLGQKVI